MRDELLQAVLNDRKNAREWILGLFLINSIKIFIFDLIISIITINLFVQFSNAGIDSKKYRLIFQHSFPHNSNAYT